MYGFFGFFGFFGLATIVELFTRRPDGSWHPALRTRWQRALLTVVLAVAIALPVRALLISLYVVKGDGAAPEIPMGSRIAVWKATRTFSAGDIIAYQHSADTYVGRFARREGEEIVVSRNGSPEEIVAPARVIGKVISVYWRGASPANGAAALAAPAEEHKRAAATQSPPAGEKMLKKFSLDDPTISTDVGTVRNGPETLARVVSGRTRNVLQSELADLLKQRSEQDPEVVAQRARIETRARLTSQPRVVRLYEVPNPEIEDCTVLYRAKLMTKGLEGRAYLEMWCRFPGLGEAFSRGLDQTISGSNDWVSCQIPFFLKKGERPDLVRLNVVIDGEGEVYAKDIELVAVFPSK